MPCGPPAGRAPTPPDCRSCPGSSATTRSPPARSGTRSGSRPTGHAQCVHLPGPPRRQRLDLDVACRRWGCASASRRRSTRPGYSPHARVIAEALKRYGMILADNGSPWYISGMSDPRFDDDVLHELDDITGRDLEVVDTTGLVNGHSAGMRPDAPLADARTRRTVPDDPASSADDRLPTPDPRRRDPDRRLLRPRLTARGRAAAARPGIDWAVLDLEHGAATEADLLGLLYAVGSDADGGDRPPQSRGAAAGRPGARPRGGRDHAAPAPVDRARSARRSRTCAIRRSGSAASRCARAGRGMGSLGARGRRPRRQRAHRRDRPDRVGRHGRAMPTRSPRSTRSTCCSSGRPTCRTASASRAVRRADVPRRLARRSWRRAARTARRAGILIYDARGLAPPPRAGLPVHRPGLGGLVRQRAAPRRCCAAAGRA